MRIEEANPLWPRWRWRRTPPPKRELKGAQQGGGRHLITPEGSRSALPAPALERGYDLWSGRPRERRRRSGVQPNDPRLSPARAATMAGGARCTVVEMRGLRLRASHEFQSRLKVQVDRPDVSSQP